MLLEILHVQRHTGDWRHAGCCEIVLLGESFIHGMYNLVSC